MKIVFRADSSRLIGTGHLVRCLTLAEHLRGRGDEIIFVCRDHPGNISDQVEQQGFRLFRLPSTLDFKSDPSSDQYASWLGVPWEADAEGTQNAVADAFVRADWVVVDHYALDHRWQNQLRSVADRILVIDDLANRPHECEILLDQNLCENPQIRYQHLVPSDCRSLVGPKYALLRQQFAQARQNLRGRDGRIKRLLIFCGGVDHTNETEKAIEAVRALGSTELICDVVAGWSNLQHDHLKKLCAQNDLLHFHSQVANMAELMSRADLAIGAAGTTSWERACLGLPCLMIVVAENQVGIAANSDRIGMARLLGRSDEVSVEDIGRHLVELINSPPLIQTMSKIAAATVDGRGVTRVGDLISQVYQTGVVP